MKAIVVVGAMVLALVSSSALAQNVVRKYQIGMQVDVDAHGQVAHVGTPDGLPQVLVSAVRQTASDWRFKPIQIAGHPVPASTWVNATVQVVNRADGSYRVLVIYDSNGPELLRTTPPEYPRRARVLHYSAQLLLAVEVRPDGSMHLLRLLKSQGHEIHLFVAAARKAMVSWRAMPVHVDGKPIASRIQIRAGFCIGAPADCTPTGAGDKRSAPAWTRAPAGQLYASDSPLQFLPSKAQATGTGKKSTSG